MSSFNNSQFNDILFNENSLDVPPPVGYVDASVTIYCDSSIIMSSDELLYGEVSIESNSSLFVISRRYVGFGPIVIDTSSSLITNSRVRYNTTVSITDSSSDLFIGTIGRAVIETSSTVTAASTVAYDLAPVVIDTSSVFSALGTLDALISCDITGSSTTTVLNSNYIGTTFDITGESVLVVDADDPYKRAQFDVTGDSILEVNSSIIQGSYGVRIDTSSSLNINAHYIATPGQTVINTESNFLSLKWASVDITGYTTLSVTANAPNQLRELGSRRRVSFVFEVDNGRIDSSIIEEHYKILRFYNSLLNINQTLDYVRRVSSRELKSYDINSDIHTSWAGNDSTSNLRTGQRGIVQKNATGMFFGKDGMFAIYRGPDVVDGVLQIEE